MAKHGKSYLDAKQRFDRERDFVALDLKPVGMSAGIEQDFDELRIARILRRGRLQYRKMITRNRAHAVERSTSRRLG